MPGLHPPARLSGLLLPRHSLTYARPTGKAGGKWGGIAYRHQSQCRLRILDKPARQVEPFAGIVPQRAVGPERLVDIFRSRGRRKCARRQAGADLRAPCRIGEVGEGMSGAPRAEHGIETAHWVEGLDIGGMSPLDSLQVRLDHRGKYAADSRPDEVLCASKSFLRGADSLLKARQRLTCAFRRDAGVVMDRVMPILRLEQLLRDPWLGWIRSSSGPLARGLLACSVRSLVGSPGLLGVFDNREDAVAPCLGRSECLTEWLELALQSSELATSFREQAIRRARWK